MKSFFNCWATGLTACILWGIAETKVPGWPSPYWDIPGDYCRARYPSGRCCAGRNDPCSVEILGTLCYCDNFCNRTDSSDCCPDYFSHCEGLQDYQYSEQRPEEIIKPADCPHGSRTYDDEPQCYFNGKFYSTRDTFVDNCNRCRCQIDPNNSACMDVMCETNDCYYDEDLFNRLEDDYRSRRINWRPKNCSIFWGHTMEEVIKKRLGTFLPEESDMQMFDMVPIKFNYDARKLPQRFDAREKWGDKIHPIADQGWCASSWVFSTISVSSDRIAIDSDGSTNFAMSPQSLLSCNTHGQGGCGGGYVDRAWHFLRKFGTVPDECYPYVSAQDSCQLPRSTQHDVMRDSLKEKFPILGNCSALQNRRGLFKMQPSYRIGRANSSRFPRRTEEDIMYEIMNRGPVQAIMDVHLDFFMYGSGVYERSHQVTESLTGHHSVKIIGWGSENQVNFWLVANSWGTEWGESGYFRIRRGNNECNIESQVIGAWAQTREVTEEIERSRQQFNQGRERKRRNNKSSKKEKKN